MLRGLRKASSNWLGKVVMFVVVGFLVVSFAIWGIGDIFRGFGLSTVARIGNTEITVDQFRNIYNDRLQQLSRQFGRPISPDQAASLGFDRQIISQLISETALDERARQLGLRLSDEEISRLIRSDRNFAGVNGQFDRSRFEAIIRQAGYTETRFIAEQRRDQLRRQLIGTIATGMPVPQAQVEAISRFQNEMRSAEFVHLAEADAGDIPTPTPEQLAAYFEERKAAFRAPEYRKITVVPVIPSEMARWTEIPDADARKVYDERKARFVTPERRQLQQVVFPTAEEARAAAERIGAGTPFAAIATERGLKDSDIDLGEMTRATMVDRAVADAAFALQEGEVSAPIQGRFGFTIVRAVKIEPEIVRTYEQVANDIKRDMAIEKAKVAMAGLYDKIEDERAGGASLAEIAQRLNLAAKNIEAVDRSGRDPEGQPIRDLPDGQRIINSAFSTEVGVETDPLQQPEGGYIWFDVRGVTPSRDRTLEEVKGQVEARWRDDEIAARLKSKATEMLDKLRAGVAFNQVASEAGKKVETATELKRGQSSGPLSPVLVDAIFRTAKGTPSTAEGERPLDQFVFKVIDSKMPAFDPASEDAKRNEQALRSAFAEGVLGEYVAQVQSDVGASVNQAALRQAVTGQTADQRTN